MMRVLDSAGSTLVEWGRQQQQQHRIRKNEHNNRTVHDANKKMK